MFPRLTLIEVMLMLVTMLLAGTLLAVPTAGPEQSPTDARVIVDQMVEAHGGMTAWRSVNTVRFRFFTKNIGAPEPWLSTETIETASGRSHIYWPVFDARIVNDGREIWSDGWPIGIPPGFFSRLTYSFTFLPFLLDAPGVRLEAEPTGALPTDSTSSFEIVRVTMERPGGSMPGEYYRLYIDPETHLLGAVEFNIRHPGLLQNPGQAIGPIYHIFSDHKNVDGIVYPSYYETIGLNPNSGFVGTAVHFLFDLELNPEIDEDLYRRPESAVTDSITATFLKRAG